MDLEKMAINIAKECRFRFIPNLLPFGDKGALFFCPMLNDSLRAIAQGQISSWTNTLFLHKYYRLVNAINTDFSRFRGWISIRGLPFDLWTDENFGTTAKLFGRLIEVDEKTQNHDNLSQAKIRVHCNGAFSFPQIKFTISVSHCNLPNLFRWGAPDSFNSPPNIRKSVATTIHIIQRQTAPHWQILAQPSNSFPNQNEFSERVVNNSNRRLRTDSDRNPYKSHYRITKKGRRAPSPNNQRSNRAKHSTDTQRP